MRSFIAVFSQGIANLDVQPGNILVEVSDPEELITAKEHEEEDAEHVRKGHSVVPSRPLFEGIKDSHEIAVRLTDLGVGISPIERW